MSKTEPESAERRLSLSDLTRIMSRYNVLYASEWPVQRGKIATASCMTTIDSDG